MLLLQMMLMAMFIILVGVGVFIGINFIYILQEIKKSVEKVNRILDNSGDISETVSNTVKSVSSLTGSFNAGSAVSSVFKGIGFIRNFTKKKKGA